MFTSIQTLPPHISNAIFGDTETRVGHEAEWKKGVKSDGLGQSSLLLTYDMFIWHKKQLQRHVLTSQFKGLLFFSFLVDCNAGHVI